MITFVCGQLCSGKTLYSKTLSHISECRFIEIGDIVRNLMKTTNRSELQDSNSLWEDIIYTIWNENASGPEQLVVSGVRQSVILRAFPEATLLWIECPREERKRRYEERKRDGDNQSFEEAEEGDIKLGILDVKKYILE